MAKHPLIFQLFVVSVDFNTTRRPNRPYYGLNKLLKGLGGVITPTHQIKLLLSPFTAKKIRDDIKTYVLATGDRVYVGKIASGSAWHNLLKVSTADLKLILKAWAKGAEPTRPELAAARKAIKGLLP